jgi:radical SAM superfamily enzyme YgiQ (UPF0313 family)
MHRQEAICAQIKHFSPELVGITCWTIDREMVWRLCESLRLDLPDVPVVIGGPHATVFPEHIFKKTHAFAVVIGEGERTFTDLVETFGRRADLHGVDGLALREADGTITRTAVRSPIPNLDEVPLPFYDGFSDFSFNKYSGFASLPSPTAAIISSRGCVFDCTYCASVCFWGKKWRFRSAANVLAEMELLIGKYSVRSFYFFDDNFPVNKARAVAICQGIIERKWDIAWACCSHVKMVSQDLLRIMKASGCRVIDFGVESGSDLILANINKKQTRADIERAFSLVHSAGILPRAYLMVGNRGESESTIDETIDLIGRIRPRSSIGATMLWLLPGTRVYNDAVAAGFISDDYWLRSGDIPYDLREHTLPELRALRNRLMLGMARRRGGLVPVVSFLLRRLYYAFPVLSVFRALIPRVFR